MFGKHFVKAGLIGSKNVKNEDSDGNGSPELGVLGLHRADGWGATTGNILSDFLLKDMTFGFSESAGFRQVPTHWQDLSSTSRTPGSWPRA